MDQLNKRAYVVMAPARSPVHLAWGAVHINATNVGVGLAFTVVAPAANMLRHLVTTKYSTRRLTGLIVRGHADVGLTGQVGRGHAAPFTSEARPSRSQCQW
jgi:hypothetical protein